MATNCIAILVAKYRIAGMTCGRSEGKAFPSNFRPAKPIFDIFFIDFAFGSDFFGQLPFLAKFRHSRIKKSLNSWQFFEK